MNWVRLFPIAGWMRTYSRADLSSDVVAGVITAILLVPQGIAYAMLAGLPPAVGLYASIAPPIAYALFGSSRTLSVGPVSISAIMVASALAAPALQGRGSYMDNALVLAMECGLILLAMAVARMGTLTNFLSHPVLSGFTSGAAIIIIVSQIPYLTGIPVPNKLVSYEALVYALTHVWAAQPATLLLGALSVIVLLLAGKPLNRQLLRLGRHTALATMVGKTGPLLALLLAVVTARIFDLDVALVGDVPAGLAGADLGFLQRDTWVRLLPSALLISLISYVESVSIAKFLANRRRQNINPNQELVGLGAANIVAALAQAMPVAGGFSRTMVNFSAGARSQMATIVTACLVGLTVVFLAPLFSNLPKAALAAIIIVAVVSLIDLDHILAAWRYDRAEAIVALLTLIGVLIIGMELGLVLGIVLSLLIYLWRASRPHIAVVGRVHGTEHFRNVLRHSVETWPELILVRVDENMSFANAGLVEDFIMRQIAARPSAKHLVLICSAVNHIDNTALQSLERLIISLREAGITVHLAEVKGPVMDRLDKVNFARALVPGQVFFRTDDAVQQLTGAGAAKRAKQPPFGNKQGRPIA